MGGGPAASIAPTRPRPSAIDPSALEAVLHHDRRLQRDPVAVATLWAWLTEIEVEAAASRARILAAPRERHAALLGPGDIATTLDAALGLVEHPAA